ncbi:DUF5919 domain-containing protein [Streptomyces venezuelae]|uniref:DUF5919 domain-containing protein n=1 Tax=Streptomyces venezuelae TaxID=54571 RepID=UPI003F689511
MVRLAESGCRTRLLFLNPASSAAASTSAPPTRRTTGSSAGDAATRSAMSRAGWSTRTRSSLVGKWRYTVIAETPAAPATSATVTSS